MYTVCRLCSISIVSKNGNFFSSCPIVWPMSELIFIPSHSQSSVSFFDLWLDEISMKGKGALWTTIRPKLAIASWKPRNDLCPRFWLVEFSVNVSWVVLWFSLIIHTPRATKSTANQSLQWPHDTLQLPNYTCTLCGTDHRSIVWLRFVHFYLR